MTTALFYIALAAFTLWASFKVIALAEWMAGSPGCECAKGRICAACLAESEAIRPKPETTKEAAA